MDAVVNGALEEICLEGVKGLTLPTLWPKLNSHLSSNGLHLCTNVKKALWSNLLNIPSLRFECEGVMFDAENPKIQSFEDSEAMNLKIVAEEHLLTSFLGIYDIKASDAGVSHDQRRVLERLAIARTDGITQNDLAKELGIKGKDIFYRLRNLESRGLIVRQSAMIRKKEAGNEGEHKNDSIVNTNMLHLQRYAKPLGRLQRLEITKEDKAVTDNDNADREITTGDGVSEERIKEDVRIKDYVPAMRAICDRLEKAEGKVLVASDIKKELGYRKATGHRAWRNILPRLKDARVVEEFFATVNNKEVKCLRLLKTFSPKTFAPKSHGVVDDDDLDTEQQVKLVKRGQITDQLLELPIEQQIYDMIDAEGPKGLIINEIYKRLGINNKRYYHRILDMVKRFGMHLGSESLNRGVVYRVWTRGNKDTEASNTMGDKSSTHAQTQPELLMLTNTIQETDSKVDAEADEEQNIEPIASEVDYNVTPLDSRSSHNLQWEGNDITPDEEVQNLNAKPSSSASPAPRIRRSYTTYPCLGLTSVSSQREHRILEKLQEEKVLLRPELLRMLESLENLEKKTVMMDKKTLERILNRLQEEGHCKCITFAIPSVTNCGRKRTIDVILHPSVYKAQDLSDRVHERVRSFEKQIRSQSSFRHKRDKSKSIPVLNNVERISTGVIRDSQVETCEAMRNNGFVLAKMVRAKLLHVFLWSYLCTLPGWDDGISGKHGYEHKNPHSTCELLELDAAIKAMPLELFLQVAGSTLKLESMIEKCRNGLRLSDLPIEDYRRLVDTRAIARLSTLIDILRRLKLIRMVGEVLDAPVGPHTTLRHSLELKPYIEEPVNMVLPSTGVSSFDLRPHVRHDFVLASRKGVDEYWNTLEYCYAASDPKAALHAFPGSAAHEVFVARSWASVRVMTADQRAELFKLVANEDFDKKISYKKCEKIAEKLNLTLEQVLRVFYDKKQKQKLKEAASVKDREFQPLTLTSSLSNKRKRSSKRKQVNNEKTLTENPLDEGVQRSLEDHDHETHMMIDEIDGLKEAVEDLEPNEDVDDSISAIHECALPKLQSSRQKRFAWTENKDRLLVIEYVRHRTSRGSKFHRTDWTSLESLPGPPDVCRRRMSTLNRNNQFRKAVMKLCNMLSVRYAKHLENSRNKSHVIIHDQVGIIDHTKDSQTKEQWDDFENKDIKMALDDVLRYKQIAKVEATKGGQGQQHEFEKTNIVSSSTSRNESTKGSGKKKASRHHLPKSYVMLMNGGKGFGSQAHKSLAVSNAIELFKLVFLSSAKDPQVPNLLAETLRRYSEHDLFTAFNYLRERNFMVRGNAISNFVLSQQFLHNLSSSPFPINTAKRAIKMTKFLHEKEDDLLNEGVDLSADLQCGDVLQLCVLISSGEISMFPSLPDEGIGEIKKRKSDDNNENSSVEFKKPKMLDSEIFSRKEKGFPGIQLSLTRSVISRVDAISLSRNEGEIEICSSSRDSIFEHNSWEAMTRYAKHVANFKQEVELSSELFKSVYSAIQKAGDQGLNMEAISQIVDVLGGEMPELIVEVLEAFGRVLKVNAYDSIHVVDSLYRSKYLLATSSTSLDIKDPKTSTNDHVPLELHQENHKKVENKTEETCTDLVEVQSSVDEVRTSTNEVHRVTILNHPEEIPQLTSGFEINKEIETCEKEKEMSPRMESEEEKCEFGNSDSTCYKPILPWVNGDGTVNDIVYKGLVRRVLGIVMQNPGILEEHVISQMNVLNPQSCRKLLELMILDSHITVRKMYESLSNGPPAMLHRLLGFNFNNKPKLVCRQHLYANPRSITCL